MNLGAIPKVLSTEIALDKLSNNDETINTWVKQALSLNNFIGACNYCGGRSDQDYTIKAGIQTKNRSLLMRNNLINNYKLSFVIPTYNAADYIQSTINLIVQSKASNCEIICVDDCSIDGTNELLEALSKKHEQLITFKLGKNQGQSFCRNFGLSKASGEYIFFFDADDTLIEAEKSLHWLLHLIDKTPGPIDLIQINNTIEEQVLLPPKKQQNNPRRANQFCSSVR